MLVTPRQNVWACARFCTSVKFVVQMVCSNQPLDKLVSWKPNAEHTSTPFDYAWLTMWARFVLSFAFRCECCARSPGRAFPPSTSRPSGQTYWSRPIGVQTHSICGNLSQAAVLFLSVARGGLNCILIARLFWEEMKVLAVDIRQSNSRVQDFTSLLKNGNKIRGERNYLNSCCRRETRT